MVIGAEHITIAAPELGIRHRNFRRHFKRTMQRLGDPATQKLRSTSVSVKMLLWNVSLLASRVAVASI
jgi:hypothetical protein